MRLWILFALTTLLATPASAVQRDNQGREIPPPTPVFEAATDGALVEGDTYVFEPHLFNLTLGPGWTGATNNDAGDDAAMLSIAGEWVANTWLNLGVGMASASADWSVVDLSFFGRFYVWPDQTESVKRFIRVSPFTLQVDTSENPGPTVFLFNPTVCAGMEWPQRGYSLFADVGLGYIFSADGESVDEFGGVQANAGVAVWLGR